MGKAAIRSAPRPKESFKRHLSVDPETVSQLSDLDDPGDWGSLLDDISSVRRAPTWRIHDRTHLELAVDYELESRPAQQKFEWDVYYFVPQSFRLHDQSYSHGDIYDDLQSYVRFAVPAISFDALSGEPLQRVEAALSAEDPEEALRETRIFACSVRACSAEAQRNVLALLSEPGDVERVDEMALGLLQRGRDVAAEFRRICGAAGLDDDELAAAVRWVDEDISRVLETLYATLGIELEKAGHETVAVRVAAGALDEASYRQQRGWDGVLHADADARSVERFEFRRHVRKRFSSSVLWLSTETRRASRWLKHMLYALAACAAMAFALTAAFYHGPVNPAALPANLWAWALAIMVAYAVKDRMKAMLQDVFSGLLSKYTPDRHWLIRDRSRHRKLGNVRERSGFVPHALLPEEVASLRSRSLQFDFETQSSPERVLHHHKVYAIDRSAVTEADARFTAITEIFRLNMTRWLQNTEDEKIRVVFADPDDQHIYTADSRRAYNINVVYRLRSRGDVSATWSRVRVVVNSRGILRIDAVDI